MDFQGLRKTGPKIKEGVQNNYDKAKSLFKNFRINGGI
jgi:hypothetical protein